MITPIRILATLVAGAALSVLAADPPKDEPKKLTPQQQKMSDCAKASKGLKGDEHKQFMSDCLKGDGKAEPKPIGMANPDAKKPMEDKKPPADAKKPMEDKKPAPADGKKPMEDKKPAPADAKKPMDDKKPTPQQDKMKSCNAMAGDKKGDDRKKFISECLKGAA